MYANRTASSVTTFERELKKTPVYKTAVNNVDLQPSNCVVTVEKQLKAAMTNGRYTLPVFTGRKHGP